MGCTPLGSYRSGLSRAGLQGGRNAARGTSVWAGLRALSAALVEDVKASSEGEVVVAVRPRLVGAGSRSPVVLPAHQGDRRTARRDSSEPVSLP